MANITVVYHSSKGKTKKMATAVMEGANSIEGIIAEQLDISATEQDWSKLKDSDAIIFGCPTHFGSVSAEMKKFMDATIGVWFQEGWKNKIAAAFTNSGSQSGDKLSTLTQIWLFAMQHGMIWVGLDLFPGNNSSKGATTDINRLGSWAGAMAQSNVDQDASHVPPKNDLDTAKYLGERVARYTKRLTDSSYPLSRNSGKEAGFSL